MNQAYGTVDDSISYIDINYVPLLPDDDGEEDGSE